KKQNLAFVDKCRIFSEVAAWMAAITGMLVLLGWTFHWFALVRLFPGMSLIKPNTAVCFLLSAAALWLAVAKTKGTSESQRRRGRLIKTSAAIVVVAGATTLSDFLFGGVLGIDHFLSRESLLDVTALYVGRMTPATSLAFLLLGITLLLLDWRVRKGRPAQG